MKPIAIASLSFLGWVLTVGAESDDSQPRRARPPEWSPEVANTFFEDAREHLVGERPRGGSRVAETAAPDDERPVSAEDRPSWSEWIDAETLATEVKRSQNKLAALLAKPGGFNNGGHLECQRVLSMLGVLFGIVDQYDKQMRWQREAAALQQACLRAARLCQVANDEGLVAAKGVRSLLTDLLNGQSIGNDLRASATEEAAEFSLLMQRMEIALEAGIAPALVSRKLYRRKKSDVAHESQLLAALAQVIRQEAYDFADDETYVGFARDLRKAAVDLSRAGREGDYEAGRQAAGRVTQSCSQCHEGYRG